VESKDGNLLVGDKLIKVFFEKDEQESEDWS